MTKWGKENNKTASKSGSEVQKITSLYCNATCKTSKGFSILQYYDIQNLRRYLVIYRYNIDMLPSPNLYL